MGYEVTPINLNPAQLQAAQKFARFAQRETTMLASGQSFDREDGLFLFIGSDGQMFASSSTGQYVPVWNMLGIPVGGFARNVFSLYEELRNRPASVRFDLTPFRLVSYAGSNK
jgi:hypothetical protein